MKPEERCVQKVNGEGQWGSFHRHQCKRRGKIVRDGLLYCKQHDPVAVSAKNEESMKDYRKKLAINKACLHRAKVERDACEGVPTAVLEDIRIVDLLNKPKVD